MMAAADVLVAGGTGFVGRRLVPALEEAGWSVRVMTRHPEDHDAVRAALEERLEIW